jgi:hypothetical protein
MAYTLDEFVDYITNHIFQRIQDSHPGELTKEEYDEIVGDIQHEEIDYAVNVLIDFDVEHLLLEYGLERAITQHIQDFGELPRANTVRILLCSAMSAYLDIHYLRYKDWSQ